MGILSSALYRVAVDSWKAVRTPCCERSLCNLAASGGDGAVAADSAHPCPCNPARMIFDRWSKRQQIDGRLKLRLLRFLRGLHVEISERDSRVNAILRECGEEMAVGALEQ